MSYYEINVAERGENGRYVHLFATAERSLTDAAKTKSVFLMLKKAFPAPRYEIEITHWHKTGNPVKCVSGSD